jgi:serine/threonine-protein kinase RsbW
VPERDEDSFEDLFEHAPFGYLATGLDGTILKVNATFLGWTGHEKEDLVGRKRFQDLLSVGGRIYHETHLDPLLRMQRKVSEIALEVVCADGRRLPVLVNSALTADGSSVRTTVLNATDRKGYERELLRARDRERAAHERMEHLQRLTEALASVVDAEQIGATVVRELVGRLGADRAAFAVVDEDGELEVVSQHGGGADREEWERFPLVVDAQTIGVLGVGARERSDEDRALLVACAGQCAQALDRVRLHARTAEAARRSAFLARTSRQLDEVRTFGQRAQRLVDLVTGAYADAAWIETAEDGELTLVARAPGDEPVTGPPPAVVRRAMARRQPRLEGSYVALPLSARDRVLGALTLTRSDRTPRFRATDLPFLRDLADRTALALENARLSEHEREVAHVLQRTMLAGAPPRDPRFQVATYYRPAFETLEVGGDWYDTFAVGPGRIGIVVGDVVGRGIRAASAMGQLRSGIRALAGADLGPARLIERLDTFVEQIETAKWATLAYAEVDLDGGHVRFACAGHPPPLLLEPAAAPRMVWEGRSPPLGAPIDNRAEAELTMPRGTRLLLYTDGLFERRDRSLDAGLDQLAHEFAHRRAMPLPALVNEVTEAMLVGEHGEDDVCLLCFALA